MRAALSLGSNIGDRYDWLRRARTALARQAGCIESCSGIWQTAPYGYTEQDAFCNQALILDTELSPEALLTVMQGIEQALGRVRTIHWGPRTIDLDLILYEDRILKSARLTVPHPDFRSRLFVLGPLAEIAPDWVDPQSGKTIRMLLWEWRARAAAGSAEQAENLPDA
ncbi:MAG: 2-amino-4-hydroxy-6-hydroxymethyldihydropteridine diphosphokinase [Anaerovoracaceae bacterium]|jgi:2-amino-4-hydroxy-6-hydroxymethyldihydropteridine diphosphokinase